MPKGAPSYSEDILVEDLFSGLLVFPACGHTVNIEEPTLFNVHVSEFLAAVDSGHWAGWAA